MFESDDYDQILSQFDFGNLPNTDNYQKPTESKKTEQIENSHILNLIENNHETNSRNTVNSQTNILSNSSSSFTPPHPKFSVNKKYASNAQLDDVKLSPKHSKRKIIDSHFDCNSKRKFPGPAGLLTGNLQESKDETACQLEFFSQDIDFSQNSLKRGLFDLPMWIKLKKNIVKWNLGEVDTIKGIKQQALTGNLQRRKAQTVTAFVETVDRSATDPLIVLRDTTGNIKCTLHRDAWSLFSPYLIAEQCALVLWKPTVLTTGSAFKKHYLNITLSNIYAIFSSAILRDELEITIPNGYVKDCENEFTVIRINESPESLGIHFASHNDTTNNEQLLEDLDSIFSDDIF